MVCLSSKVHETHASLGTIYVEMLLIVDLIFTIYSVCADFELGVIQENTFNDIPKLQTIDNIGFKSCARRCLYDKLCYAFNYHSGILVCDLLIEGFTMFQNLSNSDFSYISTWKLVSN